MATWTLDGLARLIDHTYLKPFARDADMERLCAEARDHHFAMVAINQVQTALCRRLLEGPDIHVGAAISFPLGQTTIASKVFDSKDAIANGADEIDYVVNLTEVENRNWSYVEAEMKAIVSVCREAGADSKVIFENCYLDDEEIVHLCDIASKVKPDFIKTSTGFGAGGATYDDIKLMVATVDPAVRVKAAGGVRTAEQFLEFVRLGCRRVGTSAGVAIIDEIGRMMAEKGIDTIEL